MKSQWISPLALGALVVALVACQPGAAPTGTTSATRAPASPRADPHDAATTVTLGTQNNSGLTGRATLNNASGGQTRVELTLTGSNEAHPAHIHTGTCANPDSATLHPLADLQGGMSSTLVSAPLTELMSGSKAITVHRGSGDTQTHVACGVIHPDH